MVPCLGYCSLLRSVAEREALYVVQLLSKQAMGLLCSVPLSTIAPSRYERWSRPFLTENSPWRISRRQFTHRPFLSTLRNVNKSGVCKQRDSAPTVAAAIHSFQHNLSDTVNVRSFSTALIKTTLRYHLSSRMGQEAMTAH